MRVATGLCAAVLLVGAGWTASAQAQAVPQGSYLRSCSDARVEGDRLAATCRSQDGRPQRTALAGFRRCVGDIGNSNGILQCGTPGGQLRGEVAGGGYGGPPPYGAPPPAYGGPGYGGPAAGQDSDRRERCEHLRSEDHELRERLAAAYNPVEHERIEGRLREVQEQQQRCR